MATFMTLPVELQRRILYFTDLVVPYCSENINQDLNVLDPFQLKEFPRALFLVNRHISELSKSVAFSENRIILDGSLRESYHWLQSQSEHFLQQIKHLDLVLTFIPGIDRYDFTELAEFVLQLHRLNLNQLVLSIDAIKHYDTTTDEFEDFTSLKGDYQKAIDVLQAGNLGSLKKFFVFYPKWSSWEAVTEKAVMGPNYDSLTLGKIPYKERDWRMPHGWEWREENDFGELDKDWLAYFPALMEDDEWMETGTDD